MKFIELFAGIGGFRYGLEACNGKKQKNSETSGCKDSIPNQGKQSAIDKHKHISIFLVCNANY
jgi:site-specific DNA-cytosine methylase